ncbi:hypothetical protein ACWCQP_46915, partial [Streptomyces chartreusis]
LRDGRYIDDEMLRTLLRRLDLEEGPDDIVRAPSVFNGNAARRSGRRSASPRSVKNAARVNTP